jgi:hypothetical protein
MSASGEQTSEQTQEQTGSWGAVPPRDTTAVDGQEARITSGGPGGSGGSGRSGGSGTSRGSGASGGSEGAHGAPVGAHRASGGRPAPQYGEYAPEGWVNPVLVEQERQERLERERAAAAGAATTAGTPAGRSTVDTRRASTGVGPGTSATGGAARGRRLGASPVDVLLTFVLLAMGLASVAQSLSIGAVASAVRQTLETNYTALQDPGSLNGAAMVSAVGMLVVFALVLWWSVVRLRAAKRTFWVPLLGGAVATVFSTVVFVVVVFQDDGFVAAMMRQAAGG